MKTRISADGGAEDVSAHVHVVCIIDQVYLHEEDVVLPGGRDELSDLSEVHGEGFLTQHVLPSVEEQQTHLQMMCLDNTDVQHI